MMAGVLPTERLMIKLPLAMLGMSFSMVSRVALSLFRNLQITGG